MMYGREANNPSTQWIDSVKEIVSREEYVIDLIDRLQYVWTTVSELKPNQVKIMNDALHPRTHLLPHQYQEGDRCMLKRVPKRNYIDWKDKLKYKISAKLQSRYTGPYLILRQLSPVLFVGMVDGKEKIIHAINMKTCPTVKEVSQSNIAAAQRMDFNRIRGARSGGALQPVQPAFTLTEEIERRKVESDHKLAREQSTQSKSSNREKAITRRMKQRAVQNIQLDITLRKKQEKKEQQLNDPIYQDMLAQRKITQRNKRHEKRKLVTLQKTLAKQIALNNDPTLINEVVINTLEPVNKDNEVIVKQKLSRRQNERRGYRKQSVNNVHVTNVPVTEPATDPSTTAEQPMY
jgi:hypothetical protein